MTDEPTMGEISRQLSRIDEQLGRLVSAEVYRANRDADTQRMARLEDEVRRTETRSETQRRWIVATWIAPVVLAVLTYYLASRGVPT